MKVLSEEELELQRAEIEKKEKEKLEAENEKQTVFQKIRDFWTYEKWKVIIPIIVLIIVVTSVQSYLDATKEVSLSIAMINPIVYSSKDVTFPNTFAKEYQLDVEQYPIRVDTSMIHPEVVDEQTAANPNVVASVQRYQNYIANGEIDITITNDWMIREYEKAGVFLNLKDTLSQDCYKKIEKYIVYYENENGDSVPIGIDLEKLDVVNQYYNAKPILVIPASTKRLDVAVNFVEWITKGLSN